ncbi:MAG: type IV secretion system protein TraC [Alphaproteobacteria bacterium]|nr:type IV secretion system protein TraC [Alphaproteobacteria bacterium]
MTPRPWLDGLHRGISGLFSDERFLEPGGPPPADEPIVGLLPYRSYDRESGLFVNRASCGFMLEVSPLTGATDETVNLLTAAFSDNMPDHASLQIMCWASPHVGAILDGWRAARADAPEVYRMLAARRAAYFEGGGWSAPIAGTAHLLRDFRVFAAGSMPGPLARNRETLATARRNLLTALGSLGATARALEPDAFLAILDEWLYPVMADRRDPPAWDALDPLHHLLARGENAITVHPSRLIFAGTHDVRCLSVQTWPEVWAQWQGGNLIGSPYSDAQRVPCPFLVSLSFTVGTDSADSTRANLKAARATQQAETDLARFLPMIREQAREWTYVAQKVREGHKLARCAYQAIAYAPLGLGDEAEQAVRNIYKANGWRLARDRYVQLQSFLNALPFLPAEGMAGELRRLGRAKTLVTWTCANIAPLQGEWKGMRSPCMLLVGRRGQPFYWDPFGNDEGNYNVAVIGKSGSGKSVFMQELVASIAGAGGQVIVIDDGYSFMNSCLLQGGDFVEFSGETEICLNPFSIVDPAAFEADPEYREGALSMIAGLVQQMCRSKTDTDDFENAHIEAAHIEAAVAEVWRAKGAAGEIDDVGRALQASRDKRVRDLGDMLRPCMRGGVYERYWNGRCTLEIGSHLTVFELSGIKARKDLQGLVMMTMMFLASEAMYHGDRRRRGAVVIDEAWDLLHGPASKVFIESLARRARKYNGALVTGTQTVNDYYKNDAALASYENTDWICFLAQKADSINFLKNAGRIAIDDAMERDMKSLRRAGSQYSEVMILGPGGYGVGRLMLDPFSVKLYSSTAEDFETIRRLHAGGMSLEEAVEQSVKDPDLEGANR